MINRSTPICPNGLDAIDVCLQAGGVYDELNEACTVGESSYSPDGICINFGQASGSGSSSSGGGSLEWLSDFDFGIVSNAYCNLAPLLTGDTPQGCAPSAPQGAGADGEAGQPGISTTAKVILGVLLVAIVGALTYLVVTRVRKK